MMSSGRFSNATWGSPAIKAEKLLKGKEKDEVEKAEGRQEESRGKMWRVVQRGKEISVNKGKKENRGSVKTGKERKEKKANPGQGELEKIYRVQPGNKKYLSFNEERMKRIKQT